jgi:photosystem I subunit X
LISKFVITGEENLINAILIAVQQTVPNTPEWGTSNFIVMFVGIVLGLLCARIGIQNKGKGPGLPLLEPILGKNFGVPELLAGISFGHILGVGATLGLANSGLFG